MFSFMHGQFHTRVTPCQTSRESYVGTCGLRSKPSLNISVAFRHSGTHGDCFRVTATFSELATVVCLNCFPAGKHVPALRSSAPEATVLFAHQHPSLNCTCTETFAPLLDTKFLSQNFEYSDRAAVSNTIYVWRAPKRCGSLLLEAGLAFRYRRYILTGSVPQRLKQHKENDHTYCMPPPPRPTASPSQPDRAGGKRSLHVSDGSDGHRHDAYDAVRCADGYVRRGGQGRTPEGRHPQGEPT